MIDLDAIRRARWVQNSPNTLILKACAKDGSAVLARIQENAFYNLPTTYTYSTDHTSGLCRSRYAAQRAARKAVRETFL